MKHYIHVMLTLLRSGSKRNEWKRTFLYVMKMTTKKSLNREASCLVTVSAITVDYIYSGRILGHQVGVGLKVTVLAVLS